MVTSLSPASFEMMVRKESSGVDNFTSRTQAYLIFDFRTDSHLSRSLKPSHFALYQHVGDAKIGRKTWGNDDKVWGWGVPNFNMYIPIFYVCPQWFSICIVSTDFLGGTQPFLLLPQVFLKVSLRVPHVLSPCLFFVGPFLSMPTYLHVCCYFYGFSFRYVVFRFCVSGNRRNC